MTELLSPQPAPIGELLDLSGRTALVTGGAMGIGLGIVHRLHEAGANIVIADIAEAAADKAAQELSDTTRVRTVAADVSKAEDAETMVRTAVDAFGALDIMVNNAGIYRGSAFLETSLDLAQRTLDVNLLGVMLCSQAAARQMIVQGRGGRIVNVNSVEGVNPSVLGLAHYGASKHAVAGLIKTMALELAPHGISVNNVCPGGVRTPGLAPLLDEDAIVELEKRIPKGRIAVPDDIARVVLFLSSDLASYMTGTQVVVDGGQTLRGCAV
ncbi:SDR family NAD(P)-dependent oxidoreductase [Streptomyces cinereoruber]|uniref:SDR family oxidoreductase n=1 Tax=Streptomyces cinereoruber TaxID=67260 RepID=A0ABX6BL36_9ACTN|nr:SDR family oxidoreductase [Streptomyces cinereoruber]MBB4158238.1 2-deoxy-D-gluconate 3-dehydrogenase [Streptomyces cinereoruber]MBY8819228.1 SDR family oxidoreductase [Streptomyces cinereoruber]NIH63371.1 2-deoxy-D-gluconate 3-dehydrogenase [Streptomyces cinereoruber]QEV36028.1 SDR family oxidoreductase [Streptomyces cinereoruber]